jgi:uncharacterized damage-inducible protein DinB
MSELAQFRLLARANRLANHRLHAACLQLADAEFRAPRTGFFPSLWATLSHILVVDWYYIAALHGEADMRKAFASETPFDRMAELASAQAVADARLIAWCDAAGAQTLDAEVALQRSDFVQRDRARFVLLHLLTHQVHHRGQAHAMLAGTGVSPPQLDEFLMPSESQLRGADLAALGWTEADLFAPEAPR